VIEDHLPHGSLLGLGRHLMLARAAAPQPGQQRVPATRPHLAHQLSTVLIDTSTSADTASNRTPSCASGDHVRVSPPEHSHVVNEPEPKAFRINRWGGGAGLRDNP